MNKRSDWHPVRSDVPCVKHNCVQCCIETRMPLSSLDITKIMKLGYRLNEFTIPLGGGGWRLKNVSGRSVFLSESGCMIYPYRPKGCQEIKKLKTLLERLE